jgi:hypothetical protein
VLHVTNGDAAMGRLREAGLEGDILPWRDVLHDGPVPGSLGMAQLRALRAHFIAERGWGEEEATRREFETRDGALLAAGEADEVVLWFEHDLYDQLQLIQILHRLWMQDPVPRRATLVCEAEYLGTMAPERVAALHAARRDVTVAQGGLGVRAWAAFTSPDARRIEEVLGDDTTALPFLGPALRRYLQEFPWTRDGLSRSERQALEALQGGPSGMKDAYVRSHHKMEDPVWLGDASFAWYLERLSRVATPLVVLESGESLSAPRRKEDARAFWNQRVMLTGAGRAVLAGGRDHVELNGLDRWLGGVHLVGSEPQFRWDGAAQRLLVRSTSG